MIKYIITKQGQIIEVSELSRATDNILTYVQTHSFGAHQYIHAWDVMIVADSRESALNWAQYGEAKYNTPAKYSIELDAYHMQEGR